MRDTRLREIRLRLGLTLEGMAQRIGYVSTGDVSRLERDQVTLFTSLRAAIGVDGEVMPWELAGLTAKHADTLHEFAVLVRRRHEETLKKEGRLAA